MYIPSCLLLLLLPACAGGGKEVLWSEIDCKRCKVSDKEQHGQMLRDGSHHVRGWAVGVIVQPCRGVVLPSTQNRDSNGDVDDKRDDHAAAASPLEGKRCSQRSPALLVAVPSKDRRHHRRVHDDVDNQREEERVSGVEVAIRVFPGCEPCEKRACH